MDTALPEEVLVAIPSGETLVEMPPIMTPRASAVRLVDRPMPTRLMLLKTATLSADLRRSAKS
ncbi:MAG: hypothetical protein ABI728_07535, partial [Betaproteobacteria bacterium]